MTKVRKLDKVLQYIFHKNEISEMHLGLLLEILYLSDWKAAIEKDGDTISDLKWQKINSSPKAENITKLLSKIRDIQVSKFSPDEENWLIKMVHPKASNSLGKTDKLIIDYVSDLSKNSESLESLVGYTYPMFIISDEQTPINMSKLAKDYKKYVKPKLQQYA